MATEYDQFIAMLRRANIGHGLRHDLQPEGVAVMVECDPDPDGNWWITEFGFDPEGKLTEVSTYEGEEY
jgi:hypothetical protein